ncbi:MAG: hypothetical protein II685_03395 [Clostridia bacterium]|nr:hypothetical protein [Clostridia bacterium]
MISLDKNKLGAYIKQQGKTYSEVSRSMGMSSLYISKLICTYNRDISPASYKLLCYVLGVDESFFLKDDKTKTDDTAAQLAQIATKLQEIREELADLAVLIETWRYEE